MRLNISVEKITMDLILYIMLYDYFFSFISFYVRTKLYLLYSIR